MIWMLIVTFHVYSGAVPLKLSPFTSLAECREAGRQISLALKPERLACIRLPAAVK